MSGMDSVLEALIDRVVAVADLVRDEPEVETWDSLCRRNALGVVLAKHAQTLCDVLKERAEMPRDVRRA
jgi:hypothetical protein